MAERTLTHEDRRIAYRLDERGGDGDAILYVHGAGGSHRVWTRQFRLARERPIGALDLSGHGDSEDVEADPGWETLSAYASDVLAVAEAIDARFLVGHSLGAAVTLHLLDRRDLAPDGLVLIGMGRRLPVHADILAMARDDFDGMIAFLHAPGRLFHDPDPELIEASREAMRQCGRAVTHRDFASSDRLDFGDVIARIDVPTRVICGEHDRLTPPSANAELAEGLPRGSFAVVPEAAHMPMLERPGATNQRLRTFFEDPADAGPPANQPS